MHRAHNLALAAAAHLAGAVPGASSEAPVGAAPDAALIEWVRVPGGTFRMGSAAGEADEVPVHEVSIKDLEVAKTSVTFRQYRACVQAGACSPARVADGSCMVLKDGRWAMRKLPDSFQGDDQPVVCVDWAQAKAFADWVGGRLPTEAEWEYAARSGGKDQPYPWGHEKPSCKRAVMSEGTGRFAGPGKRGCGRDSTWPVCSKPEGNTEQGLCDMLGNVWNWTADWYHPSYDGAPKDGSAWLVPADTYRVRRGLSWYHTHKDLRAANRCHDKPASTYSVIGFRPVREPL